MSDTGGSGLNQEVRSLWESKASYWDERMGDGGNEFQSTLVDPSAERLLEIQPGELVLDVACGSGIMSRRLASIGARVVGIDFSETFIELAARRSGELAERIDYRVVDCTNSEQLLALGEARFDAAVCNMALMDMAEIQPLLSTLPRLVKPGGRFVFTIQHPCFNSNAVQAMAEESEPGGEVIYAIKILEYLHVPAGTGAGMPGEPNPHYYFHRPLSELLGICFKAGWVMDGIEEPAFPVDDTPQRVFSWRKYTGIPPVLAVRLLPS